MNLIKILIADDHELFRRSLRFLLEARADWQICGEAGDGREAVEKTKQFNPDVVLLDVSMPEMNGLEAARLIRRDSPDSKVIIISQNDPALLAQQIAGTGACGFLSKSTVARDLIPMIEALARGQKQAPVEAGFAGRSASGNNGAGSAKKSGDSAAAVPAWLMQASEMAERMRSLDWSRTVLGPVETWPESLKTSISICLASRFPIVMYWGPEYVVIYNDAYSAILGSKHPWALGQPCSVCWAEIWDTIGPMLDGVVSRGQATWSNDLLLLLRRHDYPEECYFSFSFSPIRVETGAVGGVFTAVMETTDGVIGERRLRTLRDLAARSADADTETEAWRLVSETLADNLHDVPFSILCGVGDGNGPIRILGTAGIDAEHELCRSIVDPASIISEQLKNVAQSREMFEWKNLDHWPRPVPQGAWQSPPKHAIALPITLGQDRASAVLLTGVSPHKELKDSYLTFFHLVAKQIATSVADARSYDEQRQRAQALAELDRAKTAFFSNISHEFRTPLTLMMGPLEDAIARSGELSSENRERLELAHRNSLRLLKLVNTLLDFSRIEAGRLQASYEPTDLAVLTSELASLFRSAIERAGMRLTIDCPRIGQMVYVDREMWEKIVLNLLSNAFKFTFEGEIKVSLRQVESSVELVVSDTGTGIPADELPRLFERFHRVENARGRSYEGSGIGLALVQELVKFHSGSVRVESQLDRGSVFTVTVPLGKEHLPAERIGAARKQISTQLTGEAFVQEALRWLPDLQMESGQSKAERADGMAIDSTQKQAEGTRARILLADDNADMRQYINRLLREHYEVTSVPDGEAALRSLHERRADLILADVMMPRMDGFAFLEAVRSEPALRNIPIILLSARAGEESRIEGLEAGADDYLTKPFSAAELLARVKTHLTMTRNRDSAVALQRKLLAETELERERLHELFMQVPAAICLLSGPEHRYVFVNREYLRVTGRQRAEDFVGKTVREALPEFKDQPFFKLLDEVYRTGVPYIGNEAKVTLQRGTGAAEQLYHNFIYQAVKTSTGEVEGILVHVVDVTEQVLARQESEKRERAASLLAAIVDSSDDAIISKNLDGIITSWNKSAERLFGHTASEAIGKHITLIIPPDRFDEETEIIGRLRRGERIDHFETVRLRKDGGTLDISLTISPVRDSTGRVIGASKVARDITELKRVERTLRENEEQLRAIIETTPECVKLVAPDGTLLHINSSGLAMIGAESAEQVIGKSVYELIAPEDREKFKIFNESICRGEKGSVEMDIVGLKGTRLHMETHAAPLRNSDGTVVQLAVTRDVTRRKQAEEMLRKQRERFDLAIEATQVGFWFCDLPFSTLQWDDRVKEHFWLPPDAEVTIDTFYERLHPEDRERAREAIARSIAEKLPYDTEYRTVSPAGQEKWVRAIGGPFYDSSGKPIHFDGLTLDITQQKRAEERERQITAEVVEANGRYRALAETLEAEVRARTLELEERSEDVLRQSEQLRELSRRLLQAQDEERRRIARELHDSAGQTLTVLGMTLGRLAQQAKQSGAKVSDGVREAEQLVQQLHQEIRTMSYLLHPPLLDETGLAPALNWYLDGLRARSNLRMTLNIPEDFGRLPRDMELVVFRLVQESLTNIHRHSGSKTAVIRIARDSSKVVVEIRDEGKGMSSQKLAEIQSRGSGVGIQGMRERVRQFRGEMLVKSDGSGTRILVTMPLPKSREQEPAEPLQAAV